MCFAVAAKFLHFHSTENYLKVETYHCVIPGCDEAGEIDRADCVVLNTGVVGAFSASDGGISGSDQSKSFHEHFFCCLCFMLKEILK